MEKSDKIVKKLKGLLEKTYDTKNSYELAAERLEDPAIRHFINDKAMQRATFALELKEAIGRSGERPAEGDAMGQPYNARKELARSLSGNETERVLEEVERVELISLKDYDKLLRDEESSLPGDIHRMLSRQRQAIRTALDTARTFEDLAP